MLEDDRPLSEDGIVIDPEVPPAARRALMEMHSRGPWQPRPAALAPTAVGRQLIPYQEAPPQAPPPPRLTVRRDALAWAAAALIFLVGALIAAAADSVVFVIVLLLATAVTTGRTVLSLSAASSKSQARTREQWAIGHAAACWHRRYVAPRTDLDDEARPVWARAVAAANEIRQSHVVRAQMVDSVQVTMALPQRLWEIAEGLAGLSQARARQQEILSQEGAGAQRVAAKVSAQDRTMKSEARRLEARARRLEEIAGLLREADAAKLPETVMERLSEVDELLGELRARSADTSPALDPTERLRVEAQAVIAQANEAARDLALPDLGEDDTP